MVPRFSAEAEAIYIGGWKWNPTHVLVGIFKKSLQQGSLWNNQEFPWKVRGFFYQLTWWCCFLFPWAVLIVTSKCIMDDHFSLLNDEKNERLAGWGWPGGFGWVGGGGGVGINVEYIYTWYDLAWSDFGSNQATWVSWDGFWAISVTGSWDITGNHGCSLLTCTTWDTEQKAGVIGVVFTVFTFWICFNICQTRSNEDVGEWDWKTQPNDLLVVNVGHAYPGHISQPFIILFAPANF